MGSNLSHKLFLSCKKATELTDKRAIIKLSARETFQLKLHQCICNACKEYSKQSEMLSLLITQNFQNEPQLIQNNDLKIKTLEALKKEI